MNAHIQNDIHYVTIQNAHTYNPISYIYADNLMNQTKSDETAICDNNEGSFSCICDDGYEHKSDPAEGFYLNFLIPKNSKFFITKN